MRKLLFACTFLAGSAGWAQTRPITLDVDAREAPRRVLHARLVIPVSPGATTLRYPEWLPGEHGPTGPIVNLAGLKLTAAGKPVAWRRDADDMYSFHVEVPAGANALTAELDFLLPSQSEGFTSAASSTNDLVLVSWNQVLLYPKGVKIDEQPVVASIRLPAGWKAGTAMPAAKESAARIDYAPVSITTLVDSPVLTGAHVRVMPLLAKPPVRLFVAADSEAALHATPRLAAALSKLPAEANELFGARHYSAYTFLLILSDHVAWFGLEHHESSDNRVGERFFVEDDARLVYGGLLPHEMTHSWNGKYRRPIDLQPGSFETPMKGELLWIYEGLTQYIGAILTARSDIYSAEEYREALALTAAEMEEQKGRVWRPLVDTAIAAQVLYNAPADGEGWRRSVDFYPEGELLWLEVDATIRQKTGGKASLDDFCRRFHGGESGPPRVLPYTLDDVIAALNQVAPNDWKVFFDRRVYTTTARAPLAGIEAAGWRLTYTDQRPNVLKSREKTLEITDARHSLGFLVKKDGLIPDVVPGSPAAVAGVPPGVKLVAVNGRKWTEHRLREAIEESKQRKSVELIVDSGDFVTVHALRYAGGARYPRLERIPDKPDLLTAIITSRTGATPPPK